SLGGRWLAAGLVQSVVASVLPVAVQLVGDVQRPRLAVGVKCQTLEGDDVLTLLIVVDVDHLERRARGAAPVDVHVRSATPLEGEPVAAHRCGRRELLWSSVHLTFLLSCTRGPSARISAPRTSRAR